MMFTSQEWCQQQQLYSSCFWRAGNIDSLLAWVLFHYSWIQQYYSEGINCNYTSRRVFAWWKEYRCKKRLFNVLEKENLLNKSVAKHMQELLLVCSLSKAAVLLRLEHHTAKHITKIEGRHNLTVLFYFKQYSSKVVFRFPGRPFCFILFLTEMLIK